MFSGPLLMAIPVAMAAGLVSFLSPCCLPLLPGYLAYVTGTAGADATTPRPRSANAALNPQQDRGSAAARSGTLAVAQPGHSKLTTSRTVVGALLFVLGFSAVFTLYGAAFGAVGELLVRHQTIVIKILGALTIVLGLLFTGILSRVPLFNRSLRISYRPRLGLAGAPLVGMLFGVGWTPCIGPTLAAVLSLSVTTGGAGRGAVLAFAYSLGLGIPFILAALGIERAFRGFAFARRHARAVMRVGGVLLVAVGLMQLTGVWTALVGSLQGLISNWQTPI